ncbi:MAG TPA: alpha/beta hydrolase [Acidimicrobiia bacterium]|nr:alpha/beta hydrolase [Acidimicrobiia bacterium]
MPVEEINGTPLSYEETGEGEPLVLVHGSWGEGDTWGFVVPGLAESFRVVAYDRRGHGRSSGPPDEGTVHDDVADLAALIEKLGIAPASLAANSYGACIALGLTAQRPELVRRTAAHEPPFIPLLADDPDAKPVFDETAVSTEAVRVLLEAGDFAGGAERFVETVALGPGMWSQLPPEMRDMFVRHAPTFLGELRDPDALTIDLAALGRVSTPLLLTKGDQSPPMFAPIVEQLARAVPDAQRHTFTGAGHVPQLTNPDDYVAVVTSFVQSA